MALAEGEEVIAGRRPVEEAFAAGRPARRLLVVPERRAALDQIVLHATTLRIPIVEVEGGSLTSLCGFDGHQGVALVVDPRQWATLDEVLAAARAANEPPLLLVLDHLEDPQNVGTLLRSAEAVGVHGVLFPASRAAPISPAAVKASAGATEHLRLVPLEDLGGGLVDLHSRGLRVVAADEKASLTVREADLRGPLAIVIGSEGRGLDARLRRRVDVLARIPLRGHVASLNAAVAGSVILFEAAAQREAVASRIGEERPTPVPTADRERAGTTMAPDDPRRQDASSMGEGPPGTETDVGSGPPDEAVPEAGPFTLGEALLPEAASSGETSERPAQE